MNRPRAFTYLLGHWLTCLAGLAIAGALSYQWLTHIETASWVVPLLALMIASVPVNAYGEVSRYRAWQRAWDGVEDGGGGRRAKRRRTVWDRLFVVGVWLGMGYWLGTHSPSTHGDTTYGFVALGFVALTVGYAIQALVWLFRRLRRARRPSAAREHLVACCLALPKQSASPADAMRSLPTYCHPLLRQ